MEVTKMHDISVLHLFGEISFLEIDRIERTLHSLHQSNNKNILIDMSYVDHIHYMVIKRLVHSAIKIRAQEGDIKLANINPETKEMIKFTGADQYLEDYATISEAMLSFLNQCDSKECIYQ